MTPAHPAAHPATGVPHDPLPQDWRPLRGVASAQVRIGGFHNADLIAAELDGPIDAAGLDRAVNTIAARHPVLRMRMKLTPAPQFCVLPHQPIADPVEVFGGAWQEAVRTAIAQPIGEGGPVWRLIFVPGSPSYVLFAVHHAFVDGRSLSVLLRDLLTELGTPTTAPASLTDATHLSVLDRWTPPRWLQAGIGLGRRVWAWRAVRSQAAVQLRGERLGSGAPVPVLFSARSLPGDLLSALVKRARAEKATVGGALMAASWSATTAMISRRLGRPANPSMIEAMVDVRATLTDAPDVGMFASGAIAVPALAESDPWARARAATGRISRQVKWHIPLMIHALADGLDVPAYLAAAGVDPDRDGGAASGVAISNVGVWSFGNRFGEVTLRGAWSATSAMRTGPPLLAWLRTVDGRGCLSAISNGAVTNHADLTFWLDKLETDLQEMLRP